MTWRAFYQQRNKRQGYAEKRPLEKLPNGSLAGQDLADEERRIIAASLGVRRTTAI